MTYRISLKTLKICFSKEEKRIKFRKIGKWLLKFKINAIKNYELC